MEDKRVKQENPWDVPNIQEFLFYNCPECATSIKDSEAFIQHALDNHELSKSYLNKPMVGVVSYNDDILSDHEMEEIKERKPTKEELKISDKKFMELKIHKLKIEPDVLLEVPKEDSDYHPGSDAESDIAEDEEDVKPNDSFYCDLCDKMYPTALALKLHVNKKHVESFKCDMCDYITFTTLNNLRIHEKNMHCHSVQCELCDYKCHSKRMLEEHNNRKHNDSRVKCEQCDYSSTTFAYMQIHCKEKHFNSIECDSCDYKCHNKQMLAKHLKRGHVTALQCDQCDMTTHTKDLLAQHCKIMHFNSVSCAKCDFKCHSKLLLERHIRWFHKIIYRYKMEKDNIFNCQVCEFKSQNEEEMKNHQWEHKDVTWQFKCELCDATFTHKYTYREHMDAVHMGKELKCDHCDFTCKYKAYMVQHLRQSHKVYASPTIVCNICGKIVPEKSLNNHIKTVHTEIDEGGTCEHCGRFFKTKDILRAHIYTKHTVTCSVCTICEKFFQGKMKAKLIDHYTKEHGIFCNQKNTYVCHICKTRLTSSAELTEHYHTVHDCKDTFLCSNCEHKEPTQALLTTHCIDVHAMDPFKDSNSELLNEKSLSVQGVHVQEDDKAFTCDLCGKKLTSKVTLKNHFKQMHDKSNHVKCDQCERTFNYPSELKKHVLMRHTAPTKFQCSQCSYVSNFKTQLNQHVRKVHEKILRHKCTVCEKPYETPGMLQKHMLRVHDILYKY